MAGGPLPVLFIHPIILHVCFESGVYRWWRTHETEVQTLNLWYGITPIAFKGSNQAIRPSPERKKASSLNGRSYKVFEIYTSLIFDKINIYTLEFSWALSKIQCLLQCLTKSSHSIYIPVYQLHAAAAKSLQSCLTLCDPMDGSPPGSPVPGILQARTLEWVAISFSKACMHAKSLRSCPTLWDPIDGSPPGPSVHRIP